MNLNHLVVSSVGQKSTPNFALSWGSLWTQNYRATIVHHLSQWYRSLFYSPTENCAKMWVDLLYPLHHTINSKIIKLSSALNLFFISKLRVVAAFDWISTTFQTARINNKKKVYKSSKLVPKKGRFGIIIVLFWREIFGSGSGVLKGRRSACSRPRRGEVIQRL